MIAGLDSSLVAPSASQARAAAAAGVRLWSGYISSRSGVGLLASWTQNAFDQARLCGAVPLAFCSGWDDPVQLGRMAKAWNVRLCADVEDGIRSDGAWVQPWLDASGAGLYGPGRIHAGRRAAFHICARYPGFNPGATWEPQTFRPNGPCGWQWQGTHDEFGVSVDRGWYDDWFLTGSGGAVDEMAGFEDTTLGQKMDQLANVLLGGFDARVPNPTILAVLASIRGDDAGLLAAVQASQQQLDTLKTALAAVATGNVDTTQLATALAPVLGQAVAGELAKRLAA